MDTPCSGADPSIAAPAASARRAGARRLAIADETPPPVPRNQGVTAEQDPDIEPSVIRTGGSIRRSNMTHRIREMALPALLVSGSLLLASAQVGCASQAAEAAWSPDELNQLVAPIALYPDALVAQILAAASYAGEIDDADHWIQ